MNLGFSILFSGVGVSLRNGLQEIIEKEKATKKA
jgi:hypothetical protein